MTIYLLRHGESEGNRAAQFSGVSDHLLTGLGRQQARQAGLAFAVRDLAYVFTSKLSRAVETADLFLDASGTNVGRRFVRGELNERDFGAYEGRPQPPLEGLSESDTNWRICRDIEFAPPGGESMRQTHVRAVAFLEGARSLQPEGDILIISHGNILRSMTLHHLGWPLELLPEMPSRNCLLTRLAGEAWAGNAR